VEFAERLIDLDMPVFVGMTLIVMGGAAILMGQALANNWRPIWQVVFYSFLLAIATRFFSLALFYGDPFFTPLRWVHGALVDTVFLAAYALLAYRLTLVARMASQYPWLIRRSGLLSYRRLRDETVDAASD